MNKWLNLVGMVFISFGGVGHAKDMSWEISNGKGEMYLPDMFYADPEQNEQIMPVGIDSDQKPMIDRLIYPTIGNPNLFTKCDNNCDDALVVLRLEKNLFSDFYSIDEEHSNKNDFYLSLKKSLANSETQFFRFVLHGRHSSTKPRPVYVIESNQAEMLRENFLPPLLNRRMTLKFTFNQDSLKQVPEGLYDIELQIKNEKKSYSELQFNALRIFDQFDKDKYYVVNVTDTQVSLGEDLFFEKKTHKRLADFVSGVNSVAIETKTKPAFIIFNGDLHNGGSPATLMPYTVAKTYQNEAKAIISQLKELKTPIFLTVGNHDGYVATGVTPSAIGTTLNQGADWISKKYTPNHAKSILQLAADYNPQSPELVSNYKNYLDKIKEQPGGYHLDIFQGQFVRQDSDQSISAWQKVPLDQRNYVLYDGFYQWRKTYGPLYMSWTFNDNHYLSVNSYDLRQHRRTGWGMYTVNYGGGVSSFQMGWIYRDIRRKENSHKDIILLSHHDPRGGHRGTDYPYYFRQIDYRGMSDSLFNYINGEMVQPKLCQSLPGVLLSSQMASNCLHDGLQEWMRADVEFDCNSKEMITSPDGKMKVCDPAVYKPIAGVNEKRHPRYSGYELIHLIANSSNLQTLLLGHTHYHSLQIVHEGEELVPSEVTLDFASNKKYGSAKTAELVNMLRWMGESEKLEKMDLEKNGFTPLKTENESLTLNLKKAGHNFDNKLAGKERSLVIMRMTCESDLSDQLINNTPMMGFSVFSLKKALGADYAQISEVTYYQNKHAIDPKGNLLGISAPTVENEFGADYELIKTLPILRSKDSKSTQAEFDQIGFKMK
jgi:hypothetical protein